jgi:hypothetical protein
MLQSKNFVFLRKAGSLTCSLIKNSIVLIGLAIGLPMISVQRTSSRSRTDPPFLRKQFALCAESILKPYVARSSSLPMSGELLNAVAEGLRGGIGAHDASLLWVDSFGSGGGGKVSRRKDVAVGGPPGLAGAQASRGVRRGRWHGDPMGWTVFEIPTGWTVFQIPSTPWLPRSRQIEHVRLRSALRQRVFLFLARLGGLEFDHQAAVPRPARLMSHEAPSLLHSTAPCLPAAYSVRPRCSRAGEKEHRRDHERTREPVPRHDSGGPRRLGGVLSGDAAGVVPYADEGDEGFHALGRVFQQRTARSAPCCRSPSACRRRRR